MNPVIIHQLHPLSAAPRAPLTDRQLIDLYDSGPLSGRTPGVRVQANMVISADGALTGADGLSAALSSPADKRVFGVLRSLADAVVVGAGTAREERYTRLAARVRHAELRRERGQSPAPALVLITGSGDIDLERLAEDGVSEVIVHTSAQSPAVLSPLRSFCGMDNVIVHSDRIAPADVLADLRARGMQRILTEGGPTLLGQWIAAGCVDELCLTQASVLTGAVRRGPHGMLGDTVLPRQLDLQPLSLLTDHRSYIHRYAIDADRPGA